MKRGKTSHIIHCMVIMAIMLIMAVMFFCQMASGDEVQYPKDWKILYKTKNLCYVGTEEVVTVPGSIKELDQYAFYGNKAVKAIIIPATVARIKDYSIYNAPNLRFVVFYGNPAIAKKGIANCPNIRNISIPCNGTYAQQCAEENGIPVQVGYSTGFKKRKVYLIKGDTFQQGLCNSLTDPVSWKSSRKKVVTVDAAGKIKARSKGTAVITARTETGEYAYTVQVYTKTVPNRVKQIKKEEKIRSLSDYDRIKAVHNWMIRNVRYDYRNYLKGKIPMSSGTVEGALLKKKCVCQGYAVAFCKLMSSYHIPCKYVHGKAGSGNHAWNMVKLNGKWYHIDVTWDDPIVNGRGNNTNIHYTYFLKSTSYMLAHRHSFKISAYPKCKSTVYDNAVAF